MFAKMLEKFVGAAGFIAALDQSGGSTPRALELYGVPSSMYTVGDLSMYQMVHDMRTRIITSPSFNGDRILGAILFEDTMDRMVEGKPTAQYLWDEKEIIPFLKVDRGLEAEHDGVQLMKPLDGLEELIQKANNAGIFGTKMRSIIHSPNKKGIAAVVSQQFQVAKMILRGGLVPIVEPEVNIKSSDKQQCEEILKEELLRHLDQLEGDESIILKLSIPRLDDFYQECVEHPQCLCVVALSGGYLQQEAVELLERQQNMIASFSRALTEGLQYSMSDAEFDRTLDKSIATILAASST